MAAPAKSARGWFPKDVLWASKCGGIWPNQSSLNSKASSDDSPLYWLDSMPVKKSPSTLLSLRFNKGSPQGDGGLRKASSARLSVAPIIRELQYKTDSAVEPLTTKRQAVLGQL